MRGYFGIGVERVSKAMNVGSLFRTAHAFGASFVFSIVSVYDRHEGGLADTSDAGRNLPLYEFDDVRALALPRDCSLVAVEITEDAAELPSFRHPRCAAYVFGAERGGLTPEFLELADHVVKIPTRFSVNLAVAGAIIMYDRLLSSNRFARRPLLPGGPPEEVRPHEFGGPIWIKKERRRAAAREKKAKDSAKDSAEDSPRET
ncbi:MAG TPA: RNA methyltransferase [Alphaproteobacteria bacterium]|nr:RNA methyltransferase [Alphaproteobacteria bacterium]